jgi:hypothetical protein
VVIWYIFPVLVFVPRKIWQPWLSAIMPTISSRRHQICLYMCIVNFVGKNDASPLNRLWPDSCTKNYQFVDFCELSSNVGMQCCLLLHTAWLVALFISDIQSDLIGRIFGYWATVFIGQFFLTFTSSPKFKGAFCKVKSFALIPSSGRTGDIHR